MEQSEPLVLVISLKGTPHALPRGRHVGRRRPVSLTGKAKVYAAALERAARAVVLGVGTDVVQHAFAGQALAVSILWRFPTRFAGRWGMLHTLVPDIDNLKKMTLDCCQRAGALGGDDCRVAVAETKKVWGQRGSVAIRIQAAPTGAEVKLPMMGKRAAKLAAPPAWLAQ